MGTERSVVRRFVEAGGLALAAGIVTGVAQVVFALEVVWSLVWVAAGVGAVIGFLVGLRPRFLDRSLQPARPPGVLRHGQDEKGTRWLSASMDRGAVVIEGRDCGAGVEEWHGPGSREYEWVWTVPASEVPKLLQALGCEDPIAGLAARFSDDKAAGLKAFLDEAGIQFETWSRVGD